VGVAHFRAAVASPFPLDGERPARLSLPRTVIVGHTTDDPNSFTPMRSSGFVCAQHSPSSIVPHCGQIPEDGIKALPRKSWAIFHENVAWSYFANDACKLPPEAGSGSGESATCTGHTDVLTGKSARNDVNTITPRVSIEGTNIIPNRERWKMPVILALHEPLGAIDIELHGADCSPSQERAPKHSSTIACEKCQLTHYTTFD
jgi:hypothetical protein